MRRTSFVGALAAIAVGAVLAFAVQASPRWLDLQAAGLIVLLGGVADLIIRFLISDSPLLGPPAADIAAVVEPLGDPVLDAAGNPVSVPVDARTAPLVLPAAEVTAADARPGESWCRVDGPAPHDRAVYERALRAAEDGSRDAPESAAAVTTITGRPVRPDRRASRRPANRATWRG